MPKDLLDIFGQIGLVLELLVHDLQRGQFGILLGPLGLAQG